MNVYPRVIIDQPKLANWLRQTFNIHTRADGLKRITEIDPLAETITIDGQQHTIPADCYVDLSIEIENGEWDDER